MNTAQFVYQSFDGAYTVGYYNPFGKWIPVSDHKTETEARQRFIELNDSIDELSSILSALKESAKRIGDDDDYKRTEKCPKCGRTWLDMVYDETRPMGHRVVCQKCDRGNSKPLN